MQRIMRHYFMQSEDVLNSLQKMQDFGVNLICVEDGIDSSKDSGKLMISVQSAVAEIERENILVQTMEGRRQKAREGKWNGGFAPYGYKLEKGKLLIAHDEVESIRLIYDKFINTTMGINAIVAFLNRNGYVKKKGRIIHWLDFPRHLSKEFWIIQYTVGKCLAAEEKNAASGSQKQAIRQQKISRDNVYQFLLYFDQFYDRFTDAEKKEFLGSFVEQVDLYEKEQSDGRFLKHIKFRFPVYFDGKEIQELGWDDKTTVETVVLLSQQKPDDTIEIDLDLDELDATSAELKATYQEIKDYVLKEFGLKVSSLYISQIKRKCGIEVGENYNLPKSENARVPQCPKEKEDAIKAALKYFAMI